MEHPKQLRKAQTDAETLMWSRLRGAQLGVKFRRQHPMDGYILDFVCIEKRLIVELDGSQHQQQAVYDEKRTRALETLGFRVLRFWNNHALQRTDDVLESIVRALTESPPPHPGPLPRLRRGRGSKVVASAAGQGEPVSSSPQMPARHLRALGLRARLYALIREFFAARKVLEVETPILSAAGNTEPNIEGFMTSFSGHVDAGARERFLRTSPEYPLKRLLAAGVGDCYELGRVFRNGEAGGAHNPEFSMLEWYRTGWDHRRLMAETMALVQAAQTVVGQVGAVRVTTYRDLFRDDLGIDPFTASVQELRAPLTDFGIAADGLGRDDWLDLLITHRLQPGFARQQITVIHDYPATQCALARIRDGDPPLAERFELYLGTHELANGYHELNDASEQRQRFQRDNARRLARGQCQLPLDENLLAVLNQMPDCAGVALGIERLLMGLLGTDAIADVLAFPFAEA